MKQRKLNLMNMSKKIVIMTLFIVTLGLLLDSNTAFARLTMKHYDDNGCSLDYREVRIFKHSLRSTNKHIYNSWPYYIVYFDSQGKVKKFNYLKNGNVIYKEKYIYVSGKLKKVKYYSGVNKLIFTLYLDSARKVRKIYQRDKSYIVSHFDGSKRIIKAEEYDRRGRLRTFTKFTYNDKGQRLTQNYYDQNKRLLEYYKYFYQQGKKVKSVKFSNKKKLINFTLFYYNRYNKIVKTEKYNSRKQLLHYSEYHYDDNGSFRYLMKYDRKGKLIVR